MKLKGFTLVELMIVIAIIGILAAIGYPAYRDHLRKSYRAECQGTLMQAAGMLERHYTANGAYNAGGGPGLPAKCPMDSSAQHYTITTPTLTATTFTLRATPSSNTQTGDGFLELTETGERHWDRDNDGSIAGGGSEDCWDTTC